MPIRGILFDKDGVIVDFERTWVPQMKALVAALAEGDTSREHWLLEAAGFNVTKQEFIPGSIWSAGNTADLVAAWDPDGDEESRAALAALVDLHCSQCEQVSLLPTAELKNLLGGLRDGGYRLGVATNDSERSARTCMASFGVAEIFDLIMGYDSVANPKPQPDPVYRFCAHCSLEPGDVAMIGDNFHDIDMARAAGAGLAIGVLSGNTTREAFAPHVDHMLESIADLPALLRSL